MLKTRGMAASLLGAVAALACGSSGGGSTSSKPNTLQNKFSDVQFEMSTSIDPGTEIQVCKLVQMPTDRGEMAVPSAASHFTPGSHHFLAYRTSLTSMPDGGGAVVDCLDTTSSFVTGSYFEAQQPDMTHTLPSGIAHLFKPGEILVLQTHYLNTTLDTIDAKVTFTLHTMDPRKVEHEAGSILFSDFGLKIPPLSKVTQSRTCPVASTADMNVLLLWSHMHKQGVHFLATTDDPTVQNPLYESSEWSEPQPRIFDNQPPTTVHIGSHITVSCDYDNPTDMELVYGPSAATNEMCILHGMYWPRVDPATEFCLAGAGPALPGEDAGAAGPRDQ